MSQPKRRWLGGYVRPGRKGPTFVIDRWIHGEHFHVSTRCRTERAALQQLEAFEADPPSYRGGRGPAAERVELTGELILEFREWMLTAKGNSRQWTNEVARFLLAWREDLGHADLRRVSVTADLKPALDKRGTNRRHRTEAIKSFYRWLRMERGLLRHFEDPTPDLRTPPIRPEKLRRRKTVPLERVRAVLAHLPEATRDVLILQLGTGWHISEVRRFARGGELLESDAGVVAMVRHKSGDHHRTSLVHPEHVAAAQRLRARGWIPCPTTVVEHAKCACNAAGLAPDEHFRLGQMRHTVATHAKESGAAVRAVSEFLGHRSEETTRRFYIDLNVPPPAVPTVRIH